MIRRLWRALFPSVPVVTVSTEPEKRVLQSYQAAGARVRYSPGCEGKYDYATAKAAAERARRRSETGRPLRKPKARVVVKDNVRPIRRRA